MTWVILVLVAAGVLIAWVLRPKKVGTAGAASGGSEPSGAPQVVAEPETDATVASDQEAPAKSKEGRQAVLELRGRLADGTAFARRCSIDEAAVHVVIGRTGADINIDNADVAQPHAVISGSGDELMLSDLGSRHGTWINRVPCLKGEVLYISPGDTIFVGNVSFQVEVIAP